MKSKVKVEVNEKVKESKRYGNMGKKVENEKKKTYRNYG